MKRKVIFVLLIIGLTTLTGCFGFTKTFSGIGITIELDSTFIKKDAIQAPLFIESTKHIFTGVRETKEEIKELGIDTLEQYINAILTGNGKTASVEEYDEDGLKYYYAYYTSKVTDRSFGYMMIVMEGKEHFYAMNFGCLEDNLESNKDQYKAWAKTIVVE